MVLYCAPFLTIFFISRTRATDGVDVRLAGDQSDKKPGEKPAWWSDEALATQTKKKGHCSGSNCDPPEKIWICHRRCDFYFSSLLYSSPKKKKFKRNKNKKQTFNKSSSRYKKNQLNVPYEKVKFFIPHRGICLHLPCFKHRQQILYINITIFVRFSYFSPYRGKRFVLYICTHVRKWILFLSNLSVPPISVHFQIPAWLRPSPSFTFSPRFFYCCDHFTFYILTHNLPPLLLLRHVGWNFATTKQKNSAIRWHFLPFLF